MKLNDKTGCLSSFEMTIHVHLNHGNKALFFNLLLVSSFSPCPAESGYILLRKLDTDQLSLIKPSDQDMHCIH